LCIGDLIIVGTDGFFDNLDDDTILDTIGNFISDIHVYVQLLIYCSFEFELIVDVV
jgi:hypothetical protein